ncbi:MAG: hypothetical protein HQ465_18940 [Rhodospirillales bacterium]|nr:hypothetical protein [Rhodospirillales bacterium]
MVHHVCVLGNSHLASARRAWPLVRDRYPQLQVTFFGGPGKTIGDVKLVEGALTPDNDRSTLLIEKVSGRREIVISEYSAFCVVGSGLRPAAAAELGAEYSTQPDRGRPLISPAMFASLLSSILDRSIAMRLARLIRSHSNAPLFLVGQPYPIATLLDEVDDPKLGPVARRWHAALSDGPMLDRVYTMAMKGLAKSVGATFIPQPAGTIQQSILTASAYRLDREKELKDFAHTNEAYGELVIEALNALLSEADTQTSRGG